MIPESADPADPARAPRRHRAHQVALRQVAVVRSPCRNRQQMPGQGVRARIEVLPEFADELTGVELTSHLIVVGWLHEARRPRNGGHRVAHRDEVPDRGAFATRSPDRPNPLSLTVVRVLGRSGASLDVEGLDLIDGTIVLDLKPYIPGEDAVFSAVRQWRSRTGLEPERLAGYLGPELRNHLGGFADLPGARAALDAVLLATHRLGTDPRDERLSARVNRADSSADALMGLLGATLASGRVAIEPARGPLRIGFTLGERRLDLILRGRSGSREAARTRGRADQQEQATSGDGGDAPGAFDWVVRES